MKDEKYFNAWYVGISKQFVQNHIRHANARKLLYLAPYR